MGGEIAAIERGKIAAAVDHRFEVLDVAAGQAAGLGGLGAGPTEDSAVRRRKRHRIAVPGNRDAVAGAGRQGWGETELFHDAPNRAEADNGHRIAGHRLDDIKGVAEEIIGLDLALVGRESEHQFSQDRGDRVPFDVGRETGMKAGDVEAREGVEV